MQRRDNHDGERHRHPPPGGGRLLHWRDGVPTAPEPGRYDTAFDRALRRVLEVGRLRRQATGDRWSRLAGQPPARLELLARNLPAVDGHRLAARLLAELEQQPTGGTPAEARELAALAVRLAGDHVCGDADDDLAARAWRARADAQRRAGELAAAETSLRRARRHLDLCDGAPREEGLFHEARGRLLAARGHLHPAVLALRRAARLLRSVGERRSEARARVLAGLLLARHPVPRRCQAQVELHEGLRHLDEDAEPVLAGAARRCLAALNRATPSLPPPAAARRSGRAASRSSAARPAAGSPPAR